MTCTFIPRVEKAQVAAIEVRTGARVVIVIGAAVRSRPAPTSASDAQPRLVARCSGRRPAASPAPAVNPMRTCS